MSIFEFAGPEISVSTIFRTFEFRNRGVFAVNMILSEKITNVSSKKILTGSSFLPGKYHPSLKNSLIAFVSPRIFTLDFFLA